MKIIVILYLPVIIADIPTFIRRLMIVSCFIHSSFVLMSVIFIDSACSIIYSSELKLANFLTALVAECQLSLLWSTWVLK